MRYRLLLLSAVMTLHGCAALQLNATQESAAVKSQPTPFSAQGWGGTLCQEMLQDIHATDKSLEKAAANISLYQSWISGFISGANYALNDAYDISGAANPEESFEWVKQYCLQYPIDPVPHALHKLIQEWEQAGKIIYDAN